MRYVVPSFLVYCMKHPDLLWEIKGDNHPLKIPARDRFHIVSSMAGPPLDS